MRVLSLLAVSLLIGLSQAAGIPESPDINVNGEKNDEVVIPKATTVKPNVSEGIVVNSTPEDDIPVSTVGPDEPTTVPSNITTLAPNVTTVGPKTSTITPNSTTTTTVAPSTTKTTTVAPITVPTTAETPKSTSTTEVPATTVAPHSGRTFDGASFVGGIITAVALAGVGLVIFKFYKARAERNYHTL